MSEIEYTVQINAPVDRVWGFIENFDNWAEFMIGYQKMRIVDEKRSVWTLRGDVGMLAREVDLQIDITEWVPYERVEFTIEGLTERILGSGAMSMSAVQPGEVVVEGVVGEESGRPSWGKRMQAKMARSVVDKVTSGGDEQPEGEGEAAAEAAPYEGEASLLTGKLQLKPGGAMAPMIEMLMAPMLRPAVEDLVRGIRGALEKSSRDVS